MAVNSTGAGISLWVVFNNDFEEAQNTDPVLRESSRVKGVVAREAQSSYNIEERWVNDVFIDYNTSWTKILANETGNISKIYAVSSIPEYKSPAIDTYRSEVDMLTLLTAVDPEIWVTNTLRDVLNPYNPFSPDIPSHHSAYFKRIEY